MLGRYLDILLFNPSGSSILLIERFSYFNEIYVLGWTVQDADAQNRQKKKKLETYTK